MFHNRAYSFILEMSLFKGLAEPVTLWPTESSDVSSAKSFAFEFKPLRTSSM